MIKIKNKLGIGLLELMLALAVIALLLIMATRYFTLVDRSRKVASTLDTVELVQSAAQRWLLANDDFTSILDAQTLVDSALLPDSFDQKNKPLDEWGGAIGLKGFRTYLLLNLPAVPASACANLQNKITNNITCAQTKKSSGVVCGSKGMTVNFYPCDSGGNVN